VTALLLLKDLNTASHTATTAAAAAATAGLRQHAPVCLDRAVLLPGSACCGAAVAITCLLAAWSAAVSESAELHVSVLLVAVLLPACDQAHLHQAHAAVASN
jgi:hypothetical protein